MTYPLFIVTGYSGSGKSTTSRVLGRLMPDFDVFDMDMIVHEQDFQTACNHWIRIAYSVALCGRGTILFGPVPSPYNVAACDRIRHFDPIHYLILNCSDEARSRRLTERGGWTPAGIHHTNLAAAEMIRAARHSVPPIPVVDTTNTPPQLAAEAIREWALARWPGRLV